MTLPNDQIGPYRLLYPLGRGGMGLVFAAVHEHIDRQVALKVLSPESAADPQLVARFLQEGRALEQLRHPGIVRVHDCDRLDNGMAYLAMEILAGDTLGAWIRKGNAPTSLETGLAITRQIVDAMVAVHEKGIIHRDLKPENIILTPDPAAPLGLQPKIIDFGIAKVPPPKDDHHGDTHVKTAAHNVLGTSAYMAPEQCSNASEITEQADVYALGAVLFELLSGRPPFDSTEDLELLYHHVHSTPPHLHELIPTVPPALSAFISSMLVKAPEQRPTIARCRNMLAKPWQTETNECPFPGLQPFTEAQAALFFGRKVETNELAKMLEEMRDGDGRRWLQIVAPSGAGKSSLVQAGILPQLEARPWIVAVLHPSEDPIRSLATAIVTAYAKHGLTKSPSEVASALRADRDALDALIDRHGTAGAALLIVIEQFEELFALAGAHLHQFNALLSRALTNPGSPLRLLTTLRSDYIHRIEQAPELARLLNSNASHYYLRPMGEEALTQAILGMASCAGLRLEDALAARMVRDATGTDNRLPLLGHVLRSLWSSRAGAVLTHEQYEKIGGVSGALARQAALLIASLGKDGRKRAKWLILDLVQVGRGTPDTRRPRTREEVLLAAGGDQKAEEVLLRLAGMPVGSPAETTETLRLIVLSGDSADPARQRVDLVHETLLQEVTPIAGWIDAERALLERSADLEVAAHAWEQAGYPLDGLPSGSLLDHYRGYVRDLRQRERLKRMASGRARRFVDSAVQLERRRARLRRAFIATLVVATLAISLSGLAAWRERQRAEANLQEIILATDDIVSETDWELGRIPYTVDIRREMLKRIDDSLNSLPDQDQPKVRSAVAWTKHRRSDLARLYDKIATAEGFIDDARKNRIDPGLRDDPSSREMRTLLALNLSKRGKLAMARGKSEKALDDFTKSVAVLEAIGSDDSFDFRRTLATSYSEQADAELELGRASAAASLYTKAIPLIEQNDDPRNRQYDRALLASTLTMRANAARRNGASSEVRTDLDRAMLLQEPLVAAQPGNTFFKTILGKIYASLAAYQQDKQKPEEASRLYGLAIDIGETLHRAERTQKEHAVLLCQSLEGAEAVALARGDGQEAERRKARLCEVARELLDRDPDDDRFKRLTCP